MSKLRLFVALAVVCALSSLAAADVRLRKSEIIHCEDCWGRWADFNGDGLDDYLVRSRLYFNLGGRLDSGREIEEVAATEQIIRVTDFNDDGRADLLAYTDDHSGVPPRMLLGDGTGRFSEHPMPPGGDRILEAADFTNDGVIDLLLWNAPARELSLLKGNGDATFTLHQVLPWSFEQAYSFTPADINGDGLLDIVSPYEDYLHIMFAQPDGRFGNVVTRFTRFRIAWAPKVADVNGDGKADLIFGENHDNVPGITVLFGDGTGRFPGVARYVVPPPPPGTMVQYGEMAMPYTEMFPNGGGATEIQVADFIAGGSSEIAFGKMGDGYLVILGVAGGKLVELARQDVEPAYPLAAVVRFTANEPQLVVFGQWFDTTAPRGTRLRYSQWFVESEGAVAQDVASPRRRGRVIGRSNGFTGGRYNVFLEGDCPLTSLRDWSLDVEGMFVHVAQTGVIERGDAVYLDGEVYMRLQVKDGPNTRVLEGTLKMTELGLAGKLFEWNGSPCGGRWQVHRVEATLSH